MGERPDLHRVAPLALHGDGVSYMQVARASGKSLDVLSWCSLLSQGPIRVTSFLRFLIVKTVVKETGFLKTWSRAWKIISWSLQALSSGTWPVKDWNGRDFVIRSLLTTRRGAPFWLLGFLLSSLC